MKMIKFYLSFLLRVGLLLRCWLLYFEVVFQVFCADQLVLAGVYALYDVHDLVGFLVYYWVER